MNQAAGDLGGFIETSLAHGVGQACVGVANDVGVRGSLGQLLDVGAHQRRTQGAIEADCQGLNMADAGPKRCHGLTTQNPPRRIGYGAADDDG